MLLDKEKTACFSGYRPSKFDFELSTDVKYEKMVVIIFNEVIRVVNNGYDTFIIGGAPGFDIICSEIIPVIKKCINSKIKMICALPYKNFRNSTHFNDEWKYRYNKMISKCDEVYNVSQKDNYSKNCFEKRNYFMINNSSLLICYHTGKRGGTAQTIAYAEKNNLKIINVAKHEDFIIV